MALVNRGRDTRQVYAFEWELETGTPEAGIASLRRLARRIWRDNTLRRDRCPDVIAGRGMPFHGRLVSYCLGRSRIVLARNQRKRVTLVHEMVHALGAETHGKRFQNRYADLIARYA